MGHVLKIRPCASKTFAGKLHMMRPNEFLWKLLGTWVGITHGYKAPSFVWQEISKFGPCPIGASKKKQVTDNLQPSPKQMRQRSVPSCTHRLQGTALVLFLVGLLPKPATQTTQIWKIWQIWQVSWVGALFCEFATEINAENGGFPSSYPLVN